VTKFRVGDKIFWKGGLELELKDYTGTIIAVIANSPDPNLILYAVAFKFGTVKCCGEDLELDRGTIPLPNERTQ
jgi:hypothetical protein